MKNAQTKLSRRERQIMDVLFSMGKATAADIHAALPDAPSYSAVRATLRILEEKGHVRHEEQGLRYVFLPTTSPEKARRSALSHLVQTFFEGSAAKAVTTLIDESAARLSKDDLDQLAELIDKARKEGR